MTAGAGWKVLGRRHARLDGTVVNEEHTPERPRLAPDEAADVKLPDDQRDALDPPAPSEGSADRPEPLDHIRTDPSHEGQKPPRGGPHGAGRVEGLSKEEAERLLDWLEANGCPSFGLTLAGTAFVVEYDWGEEKDLGS
jgi:hypothetical protein